MRIFEFVADQPERIDKLLSSEIKELSRSGAARLIDEGHCKIDGVALSKNYKVKPGDKVVFILPDPVPIDTAPQDIPLDIVYEDEDLLVVNKPKGMVVHPAAGNHEGTLVNALLHHCGESLSGINGKLRPGIVHRIDKDTSGLLIVAKNDFSHAALAGQIKTHSFKRAYEAVVYNRLKADKGTITAPIGRHPQKRKQMAVTDRNSRQAVTHYELIKNYQGFSHVRLMLETGRTHQIRVHLSYIGHPVAGDLVYGPRNPITKLKGQCLHARVIGFIHPRTGEYLEFSSPLPGYFKAFLQELENQEK